MNPESYRPHQESRSVEKKEDLVSAEQTEQEVSWPSVVEKVRDLYFGLAEKHLDLESRLRQQIIDFYSDPVRLEQELRNVFRGFTAEQIDRELAEKEEILSDRTLFIEHYQKIFERTEARNNMRTRAQERPLASDAEYEMGVYQEGLELQVRDACIMLNEKGYETFESGFSERVGDRSQHIGMYNQHVEVPESITEQLRERGFSVSVEHESDRARIVIQPEKAEAVTLEEWEEVWDDLARGMPEATPGRLSGAKQYGLHADFRARQDVLRRLYKTH